MEHSPHENFKPDYEHLGVCNAEDKDQTAQGKADNGAGFHQGALMKISCIHPLVLDRLTNVDPEVLEKIGKIPSVVWEKMMKVPCHVWEALCKIPTNVWDRLVELPPHVLENLAKIPTVNTIHQWDLHTALQNEKQDKNMAGGDLSVFQSPPGLSVRFTVPEQVLSASTVYLSFAGSDKLRQLDVQPTPPFTTASEALVTMADHQGAAMNTEQNSTDSSSLSQFDEVLNLLSLSPITGDDILADMPKIIHPIPKLPLFFTPSSVQQEPTGAIEGGINWQTDMLALPSRWWEEDVGTDTLAVDIPSISAKQLEYQRDEDDEVIKLGQGTFGSVYLGELKMDGRCFEVVVKNFHEKNFDMEAIEMEAQILRWLDDTGYVPTLYGYVSNELSLVQECVGDGITLHDILAAAVHIPVPKAVWLSISLHLAIGLQKFFRKGVLVNDLKTDNIIVDCSRPDSPVMVKYIDMGLATYREGYIYAGSPGYLRQFHHLAPEVMHGAETSTASDIFSLGMVYKAIMERGQLPELGTVVEGCMSQRPSKRPNIVSVISCCQNLLRSSDI